MFLLYNNFLNRVTKILLTYVQDFTSLPLLPLTALISSSGRAVSLAAVEVTGVFKKCLDRQVDEGLRMTKCEAEGGQMLNSKNEYYTPKIVLLLFRQL